MIPGVHTGLVEVGWHVAFRCCRFKYSCTLPTRVPLVPWEILHPSVGLQCHVRCELSIFVFTGRQSLQGCS